VDREAEIVQITAQAAVAAVVAHPIVLQVALLRTIVVAAQVAPAALIAVEAVVVVVRVVLVEEAHLEVHLEADDNIYQKQLIENLIISIQLT